MNRVRKALTLFSVSTLMFVQGCSHPKILESIEMQPTGVTITGPGASFSNTQQQFNALGHFINPTQTEILNGRVTFASLSPDIATVDQTGLVTTAGLGGCGTALITATAGRNVVGTGSSSAVVIGTATVTVNDSANPACGGAANPVLTVSVTDAGGSVTGTVNGNLTTIAACTSAGGANCVASEPASTIVTLTSTAPATFSGNCAPLSTTSCQIVLNSTQNVSVTF